MEYRGGDLLYLPASKLDLVYRFRGGPSATLDRLGSETWENRKRKVRADVLALAHELIRTEAQRRAAPGRASPRASARFRRFEESFPYTETPDQQTAIDAVMADLESDEPMDRLIVGDVGFGKTEVAMRAAMRVVDAGRQVMVLCPTTVLSYQHLRTFRERFGPFGIEVGLLSRFTTPAQSRALKKSLRAGGGRIVIGTTSLMGRGVKIKDLGLVVVDEEHRFGVKQKERLKKLRAEVDYLALSATPIPRTLHMALTGIRAFSAITTPPRDRLPIRTVTARFSPDRIRSDTMRELRRGGQVFIVHNRIGSIEALADTVREFVPEARVAVAHGELAAPELERVLVAFIRGETNVLVCTAIIESGVDIPTVNTILINQADQFGLAQLYQLRGRVGRSHLRAWCTLLVDPGREVTADAAKRLRVIQQHTELGAGFAIASADLDLRGAGDLLGRKQHGHIKAVGFETWVELLEDAIREARGLADRARLDPEVELGWSAHLPESWVPDMEDRLGRYRRLAMARDVSAIRGLIETAEDRHGAPPPEAIALGRLLEVKCRCRALGISRLNWQKHRVVMTFDEVTPIEPAALAALVGAHGKRMAMLDDSAVASRFTPAEAERSFLFLHWLLGLFEGLPQAGG